jgi:hypothetical protein
MISWGQKHPGWGGAGAADYACHMTHLGPNAACFTSGIAGGWGMRDMARGWCMWNIVDGASSTGGGGEQVLLDTRVT